ncbi:MAG: hypothetical protein K8U57_34565 [Planctomycetes bacterium]|nr:hypothetical protein [Planctomycetota bacterium]
MRQVLAATVWWLVLTSPVVGFAVYELVVHPHHHPNTGPHGGTIVEWDETHETVAEAVVDRKCGIVTVYILDTRAKRPRPLQARSITLTLDAPKPTVVKLVSIPRNWDSLDWASQFTSGRVLEPGTESKLAGTIAVSANGRQFVGNFAINKSRQ